MKWVNKGFRFWIFVSVALFSCQVFSQDSGLIERFKRHTSYLADDAREGRGITTEGIIQAAGYIAGNFEEAGLSKFKDGYLQCFRIGDVQACNVVGYIAADRQTDESMVFTAHYDGLGELVLDSANGQDTVDQDTTYNGALDNAVGVAALIELARLYLAGAKPGQNLVFIATTADETGRQGSEYYIQQPLFPATHIIANINLDGFNLTGKRDDFFIMPRQGVNYIERLNHRAAKSGWKNISPDWIDSMNTKFDSVTFLRRAIPAVTLWTGEHYRGEKAKNPAFGQIHSVDDEIQSDWDYTGVHDHILLYKTIADYFLQNPTGNKVTDVSLFTDPN